MLRTYSSDELAHESLMAQLGEERARSKLLHAREFEKLSLTVPGRVLIRRYVEPLAAVLDAWLQSVEWRCVPSEKPVKAALKSVEPMVAALLTIQAVVDGIYRSRSASKLAYICARAIEDEWRCREMAKADPGMWSDLLIRTKRNKPYQRRNRVFWMGRVNAVLPEAWSYDVKIRLGLLLIQATIKATPLIEVLVETRKGKQNRPYDAQIVVPTKETLAWLERAEETYAVSRAVYLPTIERPADWEGPEGGGYLTDLVLRRPVARFHDDNQRRALEEPGRVPPTAVYHALNALQACPWRVNEDVRQVLEALWEGGAGIGGLPPREDHPVPEKPADIATNEAARKRYAIAASEIHRRNHELRSERCGVALHRVAAQRMHRHRRFYFPHRLDFRGRAYPTLTGLSPQGPDMCRAMLRFADEDERTDDRWLFIHGANCYGIKGTLAEREEAGRRLAGSDAAAVFHDPIDARDAWLAASEPWQYLAWCLEVGDADRRTTGLPCHVDASNNGLQILSLLAGDRQLARLTNVLPNERPADIYSTVAERATAELRRCAAAEDGTVKYGTTSTPTYVYAREWLAVLPKGLPRAATKRSVMTLPYGVTHWSAQRYVRDWAVDEKLGTAHFTDSKHIAFRYLADTIMSQVKGLCGSAIAVMKWLQKVSGLIVTGGSMPAWTAPSGWPVVHHYRDQKCKEIRAPLAGSIRLLRIRMGDGPPSKKDNRLGIAPNFVHSIDASVMALALDGWQGPLAAIHDSFGTTAPRIPALLPRLKSAFVQCLVDRDPLREFVESARSQFRLELPDPPARTEAIRAEEVMASEYLFS